MQKGIIVYVLLHILIFQRCDKKSNDAQIILNTVLDWNFNMTYTLCSVATSDMMLDSIVNIYDTDCSEYADDRIKRLDDYTNRSVYIVKNSIKLNERQRKHIDSYFKNEKYEAVPLKDNIIPWKFCKPKTQHPIMKKLAKAGWHPSNPANGLTLPKYISQSKIFHAYHPAYNEWVERALDKINQTSIDELPEKMGNFNNILMNHIEDAYSQGVKLNEHFKQLDDFNINEI